MATVFAVAPLSRGNPVRIIVVVDAESDRGGDQSAGQTENAPSAAVSAATGLRNSGLLERRGLLIRAKQGGIARNRRAFHRRGSAVRVDQLQTVLRNLERKLFAFLVDFHLLSAVTNLTVGHGLFDGDFIVAVRQIERDFGFLALRDNFAVGVRDRVFHILSGGQLIVRAAAVQINFHISGLNRRDDRHSQRRDQHHQGTFHLFT